MIKDLTKLKIPPINSTLSFNVLLHITILFTILSVFFITYVSKITTNIINDEISDIVTNGVNSSANYITKMKNELMQNLTLQNNLIEAFENTDDIDTKIDIKDKIKQTFNVINTLKDKIQNVNLKKYFPYDYYVNLFSKEDMTRQSINNEIFFYIKFTNILLIIFLISFTLYLLSTKSITKEQITEICIENVLTFTLVGIVEFLFFTNIAIKYVPSPPSLLFKSFIENIKK